MNSLKSQSIFKINCDAIKLHGKKRILGISKFFFFVFLCWCYPSHFAESQQISNIESTSSTIYPVSQEIPRGQTPEELGLEKYRELITIAKQKLSAMPKDVSIKFPLGVNYPIRLSDQINPNVNQPQWEAVGFVDLSDRAKPITPQDIIEMLDIHVNGFNQSNLSMNSKSSQSLVVNDKANNPSENQIMVIDLIARNIQTGEIYLLPKVKFFSLFRDAVNATLNDQLRNHNLNITELEPRTLRPIPGVTTEI